MGSSQRQQNSLAYYKFCKYSCVEEWQNLTEKLFKAPIILIYVIKKPKFLTYKNEMYVFHEEVEP